MFILRLILISDKDMLGLVVSSVNYKTAVDVFQPLSKFVKSYSSPKLVLFLYKT